MLPREKQEIADRIHGPEEGLIGLSHEVRRHPETGFQEYKAVDVIETYLKIQGAEIKRDYYEIPTSFRVVKKGRGKGPAVVFLAEHDAPRGVGYGCGYNVITACTIGAFLGMVSKMGQHDGEIQFSGTSAEEGGAGKVLMLEQGGFDGVEFVLMMHPTGGGVGRNYINRGGRVSDSTTVFFRGKSVHSSVPSAGTNALSATISMLNQIDMIRPTSGAQDNVNGAMLEGGTAGNIIPEFSKYEFCIRAETVKRTDELTGMTKGRIRRAQNLTGAAIGIEIELIYAECHPCLPLCKASKENMGELGINMCYPKPGELFGLSDIDNVSIRTSAIHDHLSITNDASIEAHSIEYARVAAESRANEICILGAEGLTVTTFDILTDGKLREESTAYHKEVVSAFYGEEQRILEGEES